MFHNTFFKITLALCLSACCCRIALADQPPGTQKATEFKAIVAVELDYLLYLPPEYDQKESWPLMLFLHGAGERGDDLERVKVHGPPKLIAEGKHFPFIVVSPQCPTDSWWNPIELNALLDSVQQKYKVDVDRVYLTGLSMGGYGSWDLASYAPDRFAAIAPICGGGKWLLAKKYAHVPLWAFHGAKDGVVPVANSQKMIDALKAAGGNPQFTIYPEAGHNSWTETYNNPQLYEWFLKQKRASKEVRQQ